MNRKQRRADGKSGKPAPRLERDDPVDLHSLGVQAFREGRHGMAVELIAKAIALDGQVASFHYNLAIVLKAQGRLTEAAASYQRALTLKPDYVEAHNNLGNVWKALGERGKAQASFARALELRPGYAEAHYNLGVLFGEGGDRQQAAAHLQACLVQDPGDTRGVRMLLAHLGLEAAPARTPEAHLIALYDQRSRSWDSDRSYHGHEMVAQALRAHAPDRKLDILDAGCGTGLAGALVRDLAQQLDGVDLSPAMLEQALGKQIYDRLQQDDMIAFLCAHPDCYDAIIGAATLIHFGDLRAVFEAAARALRDGGIFVFTLFSSEAETVDFAAAAHFDLARHGCYGHRAGYVERLAKETGFTTELLEKVVHERDLNDQPVPGLLAVLRRR
jgi:predicted TPR repeat methyltransferase